MRKIIKIAAVGVVSVIFVFGYGKLNVDYSWDKVVHSDVEEWLDENGEYTYPCQPGDDAWYGFETHQEMVDACNIPEEVLTILSTEQLLKLVMEYPLLGDIYAFNTYSEGVENVLGNFNGFQELKKRDDLTQNLLAYYHDIEYSDNIGFMDAAETELTEWMLVNRDIARKMTEYEKEELIRLALEKREEKKKFQEYFSDVNSLYNFAEENKLSGDFSSDAGLSICDTLTAYNNTATTLSNGTYVYTPNNTPVYVTINDYLGDTWSAGITNAFLIRYPNATKMYKADNRFNCHSYAWFRQSTYNSFWMPNPILYVTDGSYRAISSSYATTKGQKVTWYSTNSDGVMNISHSGVVYQLTSVTNFTIISKWGEGPIMVHTINYSPYSGKHYFYTRN